MSALDRARLAYRRYGFREALTKARERALKSLALREAHVWYELDLAAERPRRELAPEMLLRCAAEAEADLLDGLPTVSPAEGRERIRGGHDLWLVLDGEQLLFACWIFRGETPVAAAPGGSLSLPGDTVCLEDSIVLPAARGRGVAPGAWTALADTIGAEGFARMITKVATDNVPSRKAVMKSGFAELAIMRYEKTGPRSRTWLEPVDPPSTRPFVNRLAEALGVAAPAGPVPA
jgi:RimJ/RimL family protein N-acetyltransferase